MIKMIRRSIPSTTSTHWPGVSTYAVEQSAITKQPFVTNFSLGNGYNYFIKGKMFRYVIGTIAHCKQSIRLTAG